MTGARTEPCHRCALERRGTASASRTIAAHVDSDVGGLAGRGRAVDGREGEPAGLAVGVVEIGGGDGGEGAQIAEAGEGGVVPQDAVAARGDEEGHDDVGVVLPEVEVVSLDVGDAELHLAEAVERFIGLRLPALLDVECLFALDGWRAPACGCRRPRRGWDGPRRL